MKVVAPSDMGPLLRDFIERIERTNRALEAALERRETLDERIELDSAKVREAVRLSGETWPLPLP